MAGVRYGDRASGDRISGDRGIPGPEAASDRRFASYASQMNFPHPYRKAAATLPVALAFVLGFALPSPAADTFPSQDACHVSDNNLPSGNCGPFTQVFAENFNGDTVALGSFSDCDHNVDTPSAYCGGLPSDYQAEFWAYPAGWYDTANPKNHSNGNTRTFGGEYRADKTVSVTPNGYDGGGTLVVDMYRPTSGDNYVGAVVPKKCTNQTYGKYSERFRVTKADPGFKMAHLFYQDPYEMDFPEAGGSFQDDTLEGFTHPGEESVDTGAAWLNVTHTTSIEWTPDQVKYYLDGKLVLTANDQISDEPMEWVLQNESALSGAYAAVGAHATIATTWVTCYSYVP